MAGDSLLFATTAARREFTTGSYLGTGAMSVAGIVKPSNLSAAYTWMFSHNLSGSDVYPFGIHGSTVATYNGTDERAATPTITVANDEWYLFGYSKAAGVATPRYHIYRYSTDAWEHGNFNGTQGNYAANIGLIWSRIPSEELLGNYLIGAVWDSELADATFETLELAQAAWVTAAPDEAWRFNTTGTITPFVGTSTQTTAGDETLDVGDSPSTWEAGAPAGQTLRPDADTTTTGWTTTPLWSKINEVSADGTVVTATAS